MAAGRTAPLKSFLLDQSGVAGVGNIYADEALYRARLHPLSPAGSMKPEHLEALRDAVVAALEAGIDARRLLDRRLPRRARREGDDAGRVPRPHPRGRALPFLRRRDRPHRRRRPLDLLLPELPGAPAPPSASAGQSRRVAGKTVKTEAIVLRSIRYGEADRILHLYSKTRGRFGAIAKGARKPKSRFGGRLEPFFRLDLLLHEGRSDLMTVTGVTTVDGYPRLRSSGPALSAGARACDAVLRLLDSAEPNLPAYNLLCRYLALLDDPERAAGGRAGGGALLPAEAGAGRRLRARAGLLRALRRGRAPGRLLRRRRRRRLQRLRSRLLRLSEEAHRFMVEALAQPLAEAPPAEPLALRQVERAVGETLEHHAHVQLRAAA